MEGKYKKKKVAVVMPVHNTPYMYLTEALASLEKQSFQDFRLICVDDKSTDVQTICILREWSEMYENMQVVYLPNSVGAAEARNIGLRMAKEEYIIFLDSDDIFEENFLKNMYEQIEGSGAEVCVCGWKVFSEREDEISIWKPCADVKKNDEKFLRYHCFNPWSKLCRREFLIRNNIYFQSLPSCNDVYYSICVLLEADNICYIEEPLIRYRAMTTHQISARRDPMNLGYAGKKLIERYYAKEDLEKRIQILLVLLLAMRGECKTDTEYHQLSEYILDNIIETIKYECIQSRTIKRVVSLIKKHNYNCNIAQNVFSYEGQLYDNGDELICKLKEFAKIYLWGLGIRGTAFQKFCKQNSIVISAVADSKNENIGKQNSFGNTIISTSEMLKERGLIIACNEKVYKMLEQTDVKISILNLQQYCPL